MRFFSNKIYVNGASKNFNDIINDVAGGMKKQASVASQSAEKPVVKQAKEAITDAQEGKLPPALVAAIKRKEGKPGKSKKKSSINGNDVKIASVNQIDTDTVEVEFVPENTKVAEIEISDDGSVKMAGWNEGMAATEDSNEAGSSEDNAESKEVADSDSAENSDGKESCEACGMSTMASSGDFVKIANLTDKQKAAFRSYWQNVWPKEFIDAVLTKDQ